MRRHAAKPYALEGYRAGAERVVADDGTHEARLADAIAAQKCRDAAVIGGEGDVAQRKGGAVAQGGVLDSKHL